MAFNELPGDFVIIKSGGVYKHAPLYEFQGRLFAGFGKGYIQLMADGGTSKDRTYVEQLAYSGPLYQHINKLYVEQRPGTKLLSSGATDKLLALPSATEQTENNDV